jgi:DNA-binding CsgD family transcriptional regulator
VPATAWYAAQVVANAERAGNTQLRAGGLRVQLECEAIRGDTERIAELEREIAQSSYRGSLAVVPMLVGRALAALAGGRFADARVTLGTTATDPLQPHEDRMRCALLAVACAAQRDRPATLAALADLDRAIAADGGQPQYDSDRRFAARLAALANVVIGRNVVAQRALQSLLKTDDDFDAFDDAIAALQGRNREGFAQATRALRGSGFGGIARVIEQVGSPILEERTEPEISLTAAEKQVLVAMAQGLSNQAIADAQRRTINTVRTHVSSILRKLGCESRGEAVAAARRAELI